jgi:hypothetical protein
LVITNYDILPDWLVPNPAPVNVVQLAGGATKKVKGKKPKMAWADLKVWREKLVTSHPEANGVVVVFDEGAQVQELQGRAFGQGS